MATSAADRLAQARTLAWLEGGRLDPKVAGITLLPAEVEGAHRFGLAVSSEGVVRLIDEQGPEWWPTLNVDAADRRTMTPGSADAILLRHSPNRTYRSFAQKAAIRALVTQPSGSGLMASLPTGAGKSLLFQIAALLGRSRRPGACVIVITPTIALALDHERSLSAIPGLEASRALTGDQAPAVSRSVIDAFRRGEVPVLLLGPEAALRSDIAAALAEAAHPENAAYGLDAKLTHLFVDEAHIVESWGRGFRPDFQRLPGLLARLREADPDVRLVLLSATLTPAARQVLRDGWGAGRSWLEVDAQVPRYEHDVVVEKFATIEDRLAALSWTLDRVPRPAILYTTEVDQAADLYRWLTLERGFKRAGLFTGDTPPDKRRQIVRDWAADDLDLVVATSAFGMGVDKTNVRSIVHACLPEGPSRWYQEIGRAARDGGQGLAALLFTATGGRDDDVYRARGLAVGGWLTRDLAEKRWAAMLKEARDKGWSNGSYELTVDLDAVREGLNPKSSDYNRNWNMALLTLLQRSGAVEIQAVSAGDDVVGKVWRVRIRSNGLLNSGADTWDRVFATREAEVERARDEVRPFIKLAERPDRICILRGAFELIEPSAFAPPCGRCPACRAEGVAPPTDLPCGGLEVAWPEGMGYAGPLPNGPVIIEPSDPSLQRGLASLVTDLAGAGVEQFIVPDRMSAEVADFLAGSVAQYGLLLCYSELATAAVPAPVPTALLTPSGIDGAAAPIAEIVTWGKDASFPVGVVAEGSRILGDRRLDQWASRFAPITQMWLAEARGNHRTL